MATRTTDDTPPLAGLPVITLRPVGQSRALLTRLRRLGARPVNLAMFATRPAGATALARQWRDAARADRWLFTSPASVRFAARLLPELFDAGGTLAIAAASARLFAPGPGTAVALAECTIMPTITPPRRFDSEGLLALTALAAPLAGDLALVGAPDGRSLLTTELVARGATVRPLHVYRRVPATPDLERLDAIDDRSRPAILVSSGQALERLCRILPTATLADWRDRADLVLASARLAAQAERLGFRRRHLAASATPDDLLAALARLAQPATT